MCADLISEGGQFARGVKLHFWWLVLYCVGVVVLNNN